jgi:hypothetical protein
LSGMYCWCFSIFAPRFLHSRLRLSVGNNTSPKHCRNSGLLGLYLRYFRSLQGAVYEYLRNNAVYA